MTDFETLGLVGTPTEKEITRAYRKLAMKHHPDRGGDAEKFKALSVAYEAVKNRGWRDSPKPAPSSFGRPPPRPSHSRQQQWTKPEPPAGTWRDPNAKPWNQHSKPGYAEPSGYAGSETMDDILQQMKTANRRANFRANPPAPPEPVRDGNGHEVVYVPIREAHRGCSMVVRGAKTVTLPAGVPDGYRLNANGSTFVIRLDPGENFHVKGLGDGNTIFTAGISAGDMELDLEVDAIDLITGAWIKVKDFLGEELGVRIPPGHDPLMRLKVANKGYNGWMPEEKRPGNYRKDLYIKVKPIFKAPANIERDKIIKLYNTIQGIL